MEDNLQNIKKQINQIKGTNVMLRARVGRRGAYICSGVIDGLYPEVFTVLSNEHGHIRRYCFCYSEILTRHVEIAKESGALLSVNCKT